MARTTRVRMVLAGCTAAAALLLCAGTFLYASRYTNAAPGDAPRGADAPATTVEVMPLALRDFERRVQVQGTVEAKRTAVVSAKIPGSLEAIFVDEGDTVSAGQTHLFQTDALKLQKAVEVAQQNLAIARCGRREKEAYQERLTADFEKARIDYERHQLLYESNSIAVDVLEQQQSRYRQSVAMCKHAQSLVDLALEQERQAEAALAISQKDLGDTLVIAPLTGKVTHRFLEPGEMAGAGTPVLRIEDPSLVEVSAFLPSQYFAETVPGETQMRIRVYDIEVGDFPVSFRSPTINPKLRTFEVKCEIQDPPEGVVSGAMADIAVLLGQRRGFGVPKDAVQIRGDKPVIFGVEEGEARMLPVETGFEYEGMVEIAGDGLREGLPVIVVGQFHVQEGRRVAVRQETP